MLITNDELIAVLSQLNPWWRGEVIPDLATWRRAPFRELFTWIYKPPAPRAILLSGARQIGKTTLLLQAINELLLAKVPAANILYATFDHPIIKMTGIDAVITAWREREPKMRGPEYLFLDEAQFISEWGTWVKHQVDFIKSRRIVFTDSAMPLLQSHQESGVGRWHTIRLTTLSFYEYLQLKQFLPQQNSWRDRLKTMFQGEMNEKELLDPTTFANVVNFLKNYSYDIHVNALPKLPKLKSLRDLFNWKPSEFLNIAELAAAYSGHFQEYLVRSGFPQTAQMESINQAQRLLREDIIDKVLKRDMTALFKVRLVQELERTLLYLCMHDGGLLDMQNLCANLEVKRPTAQHFIELLEAAHLIYRLPPFGYGKDILRAKFKIYLADPAIAPAVLLKDKSMLDDPIALSIATETAVFKHLFAHYYAQNVRFSFWHGNKNHEVDLLAEIGNQIIPFEVKYRTQHTGIRELKGLLELCQKKSIRRAYLITKSITDFGLLKNNDLSDTQIMRIPAALLCYWMGESELSPDHPIDDNY